MTLKMNRNLSVGYDKVTVLIQDGEVRRSDSKFRSVIVTRASVEVDIGRPLFQQIQVAIDGEAREHVNFTEAEKLLSIDALTVCNYEESVVQLFGKCG